MNRLALSFLLAAAVVPCHVVAAIKPCAELEREIAAKLDARGVVRYELTIVAPDEVGDRRVVGSCEGGTKRIVYRRLPADAAPATAAPPQG